MAPQNLNMELLLTSQLGADDHSKLILKEDYAVQTFAKNNLLRPGTRSQKKHRRRKKSQSFKFMSIEPFNVIQSLLTPGISAASCNEETLSSSFLLLDGILTISLGELSSDESDTENGYDLLRDATERWGARLETNISVGNVSYEYQHESEEAEEKCMSVSSSDGEDEQSPHGAILSQKLDLVPLVLDDPSSLDINKPNPDRYVPPSHKMVADCLKASE